ncbi:MAG: hypothetical protein ACI4A3_08185 [Lachnospiraceae bacterium]
MTKNDLLVELAEMMDYEEELSEDMELSEIEEWDSLAKLSLMAMAKKDFAKTLTAAQIKAFVTVEDICNSLL